MKGMVYAAAEVHDDALLLRVGEFETQLAAWRAAGRLGVPVLALEEAAPARWGWCLSCGSEAPGRWRCADCLEAVARALELADHERPNLAPWQAPHAGVPADIDEPVSKRRPAWWWHA